MTINELIKELKQYFTVEELDVVFMTLTRRLWTLEDCKLEDSYCYPRLFSFREKIRKLFSEDDKNGLQISKGMI